MAALALLSVVPPRCRVARARVSLRTPRGHVARAGGDGSYRVIEYGDGTAPRENANWGEAIRESRNGGGGGGRGRGGRGGRGGGRGRGARGGRGPPRRDAYEDEYERDDRAEAYYDDRPRGRGSLREKGRGGRGVSRSRGFNDGDDEGYGGGGGGGGRGRRDDDGGGSYRGGSYRLPSGGGEVLDVAGQEGRIIGKGGGMVAQIQDATGARLDINRDDGTCRITGGDVAAAVAWVNDIVAQGQETDGNSRGVAATQRKFRPRERVAGVVFGDGDGDRGTPYGRDRGDDRGDDRGYRYQEAHGDDDYGDEYRGNEGYRARRESSRGGYGGDRGFDRGPPPRRGGYRDEGYDGPRGGGGGGGGFTDERVTTGPDGTIYVPCAGQEGRIIGKGGSMVQTIQDDTGAYLNVRKEKGVVEISGGDARAAADEVLRIVAEGRKSDAERGGPRDSPRDGFSNRRDDRYDDRHDDRYDDRHDDRYDSVTDDNDDEWILEGLEDELEEGRRWDAKQKRAYQPELLSKYVEDDFEPMVYTREPDEADEYNFFSGGRFNALGASEGVSEALKEFGIERPSHIQALSYKVLSSGAASDAASASDKSEDDTSSHVGSDVAKPPPQHVLLADQAGSGKTLAYLLPLLQRVAEIEATEGRSKPFRPRLLILAPTSELANQVVGVARLLSRGGLRSRSLAVTGGGDRFARTQIDALKEGVDVVVGTPGRVAWLVESGKLDVRDLTAVVMDECDVLLGDSFEFAEQVRPLRDAVPSSAQFVLVTATIPEDVLRQLRAFFDGALRVVQGPGLHRPAAGLLERLVDCSGGDVVDDQSGFYRKYRALEQLLEAERAKGEGKAARRILLFCNKIETCRRLENVLARADRDRERLIPVPYHAALSPERRKESLAKFLTPARRGETPMMLVCTDRASRGLDAAGVSHVILFDFPRDPSEYVRRVGRTARGALGTGEVSVLVLGRQVRLAREIMRRNTRGDPVEATPQF